MKQLNSSQGIEEYQNVAMEKNNSKKPQKNKTKQKIQNSCSGKSDWCENNMMDLHHHYNTLQKLLNFPNKLFHYFKKKGNIQTFPQADNLTGQRN